MVNDTNTVTIRWFVFETLTGAILHEFNPVTGTWSERVNEPETLTVTVPLEGRTDWRNLATPWKHGILADIDGRLLGGPIQPIDYRQGEPLSITARGIRSLLSRRTVLPPETLHVPLVLDTGEPNDILDTHLQGLDLGSIGARLVEQACAWPGFHLPLTVETPRPGTHERTYKAVELKNLDDALTELSGVDAGPDFAFPLHWRDDTHIGWQLITGTGERPLIAANNAVCFDGVSLQVRQNPSRMGSLSWGSAGRGNDTVMIASAYDPYLVDSGVPLMEIVDSSHTNVTQQDTLDHWAAGHLRTARGPAEFWSLHLPLDATHRFRDYTAGDYCDITVTGDPYIPDGTYRRRILETTGSLDSHLVTITCGENYPATTQT